MVVDFRLTDGIYLYIPVYLSPILKSLAGSDWGCDKETLMATDKAIERSIIYMVLKCERMDSMQVR